MIYEKYITRRAGAGATQLAITSTIDGSELTTFWSFTSLSNLRAVDKMFHTQVFYYTLKIQYWLNI